MPITPGRDVMGILFPFLPFLSEGGEGAISHHTPCWGDRYLGPKTKKASTQAANRQIPLKATGACCTMSAFVFTLISLLPSLELPSWGPRSSSGRGEEGGGVCSEHAFVPPCRSPSDRQAEFSKDLAHPPQDTSRIGPQGLPKDCSSGLQQPQCKSFTRPPDVFWSYPSPPTSRYETLRQAKLRGGPLNQ